MTIETWNIVLNAVIAVGLVVYGIWLKYITDQQLKSKDATIQAKDAEIARLQAESAPTIAAKYKAMKEYADQITEESQRLTDQLNTFAAADARSKKYAPANKLVGESSGLLQSAKLIDEQAELLRQREHANASEVANALVKLFDRILDEAAEKQKQAKAIIEQ